MTVRSAVRAEIVRALETALIAAGGAMLFAALHIPAAPILGAMAAVAAAALAGRRLGFSHRIRAPQLAVMGMAAGASVSPATLAVAAVWPLSIVALVVASALMQFAGYIIFRRLGRFDPLTAFLAAAPGSLSAVLILAEEEGADVPKVVVPQTIRVTGIVGMTPFLLYRTQAVIPIVPPALVTGVPAWVLLLIASASGWFIAHRLRWPLPAFLGVLAGSIAVHVAGTVSVRPPAWLVTISLVGLGGVIVCGCPRFCKAIFRRSGGSALISFVCQACSRGSSFATGRYAVRRTRSTSVQRATMLAPRDWFPRPEH